MLKAYYIQGRRPGDDAIEAEIASGCYEHVTKLKPGDVVLDVGAHIGFFTTHALDVIGQTGWVYAVEPEPDNYGLLVKHTKDFVNVKRYNVAAWDANTAIGMRRFRTCMGHSCVYQPPMVGLEDSITVEARTLDDLLLPELTKLDFVKIDVEAAEQHVLHGAWRLLDKFHPAIAMELHSGVDHDKLAECLLAHDYRVLRTAFGSSILPMLYAWSK